MNILISAKSLLTLACGLLSVLGITYTPAAAATEEVNLYSYRQPFLIKPMIEAFTAKTGIKVNTVYAKKGMLEKIRAAGANNPADAILTTDIGRLDALRAGGVLAAVQSKTLNANVPTHLRHPEGLWFGLTTRARVALVSKERVRPGELTSIADLASPKFRGRICMRSGKHSYNVALIASVIAHDGEAAAEKWLRGVKANLARKPQGNDRAQAKAVFEGLCDVAISNNYYMGNMITNEKKPEQKKWAAAVRLTYLDQNGRGQHVNVSGAGVLKGAKHRDAAIELLEFLSGEQAQEMYARDNHEYPVKSGVARSKLVQSWGDFKTDTISIEKIAKHRPAASKLVDKVGFNDGPNS
ncbi:MAG: Fe(3+) ABC transporter substrate-binding protein [Rhodospirillaceae bacterium]|nr:Fe(3+) ABC transporter substrate-binding protein [Rhodospirillaceae bacterium]